MFNNRPGKQLKRFSRIVFLALFTVFALIGILVINFAMNTHAAWWVYAIGVAVILIGDFVAWSNSILINAFGTLVDSTEDIRDLLETIHQFNR